MLGIGTGIYKRKPPKLTLISTYTSNFTSDTDGWAAHANLEGTLTLAANQTAPGSGEAGWLKGTFDTNQTNPSDLEKITLINPLKIGDYFSVSFKVYLDNPGASLGDYWDGTDDVDGFITVIGGKGNAGSFSAIPQEQVVTIDHHSNPSGPVTNINGNAHIRVTSSPDQPQANAVFYIKDIVIKQWRYIY
tara:strand:+ start:756 stop:1325 length:570 start_codon:yes stop_codon:yes gene_type:complete